MARRRRSARPPRAGTSTDPAADAPAQRRAAPTAARAPVEPAPSPGRDHDGTSAPHRARAAGTLAGHPIVRAGTYCWALLGFVAAAVVVGFVVSRLRLLVVPLVLALFPAALLAPAMVWLRRLNIPGALASLLVILASLGTLAGTIGLLAPAIAAELPGLTESARQGLTQLQALLDRGPFGIDPNQITAAIDVGRDQALELARGGAVGVAAAVGQGVVGFVFGLVALFFYLKDGPRIAAWVRDLFPAGVRSDVAAIGTQAWTTLGSYFRGQLLVALVDAVFIGLGLWILRIPLALPLAVIVFIGGLFPIVGAFVSGALAILVALADAGPLIALAVLGLVVAVQQLESNVLAPVVLGKATALHPLGVIVALTAGGVLLGVLGAFLAVPVAASATRAIGYLRDSTQGREGAVGASAPT